MLTFARKNQGTLKPGKQPTTYTKTVLSKVDWKTDFIVQYIPISTPDPRQPELVGKLVSMVSIYPVEGPSRSFVDPDKCQSASKRDPLSACNRDPLLGFVMDVTSAPLARVGA